MFSRTQTPTTHALKPGRGGSALCGAYQIPLSGLVDREQHDGDQLEGISVDHHFRNDSRRPHYATLAAIHALCKPPPHSIKIEGIVKTSHIKGNKKKSKNKKGEGGKDRLNEGQKGSGNRDSLISTLTSPPLDLTNKLEFK